MVSCQSLRIKISSKNEILNRIQKSKLFSLEYKNKNYLVFQRILEPLWS